MTASSSTQTFLMGVSVQGAKSALCIFTLALAIEVLYMVPYGLTSSFRPLLIETFGLDNHDIGKMSSVYGIVSMCLYFPGGYVADRFPPKWLMVSALLTTAACCCYLSTTPSLTQLVLIWALLAAVGTLLFWSAFVSVIRQIGGNEHSGKAFGFEQASRGIVSALMTLALAASMRQVLPAQTAASEHEKREAMTNIFRCLAMLEVAMAFMIMFALPSGMAAHTDELSDDNETDQVHQKEEGVFTILGILQRPTVWLHALIVVSAYSGNLATHYFSGLATYGYGLDVVQAAEISSLVKGMRACSGLLAGAAADRWGKSRICCGLFLAYICAYSWVAVTPVHTNQPGILIAQVATSAASVFGIAGVYFALLDDAKLPMELTGSAVGVISVIGFTPDIFMGQISGYWLDTYPGGRGYRYFYLFMAATGLAGFLVTLVFALAVGKCSGKGLAPNLSSGSDLHSVCADGHTSASSEEDSASSVAESRV
eukprot:TRINITY_DN28135_c0_g1_i1.p1 TRINITY_DN28135_c0_g1~~TRINITY_DN28135_c0_g1_i1.p1  ORF type:complete len:483 (+),score=43.17 TRINITY_DN28135_c0_g1_i1:30-1478(+)